MAKHKGRGIATIEYPAGMNQNGDPSQAWVKLKPDGRVDVFAGTVDIGQGSRTVCTQIVADTLGVPYDWVTMDNTNTDSSPVCTGASPRAGRSSAGTPCASRPRRRASACSTSPRGSWRSTRPTSRSPTARSSPRAHPTGRSRSPTWRRGDVEVRRADHRHRRAGPASPRSTTTPARSRSSRTRPSPTRPAWPRSRWTTRPAK